MEKSFNFGLFVSLILSVFLFSFPGQPHHSAQAFVSHDVRKCFSSTSAAVGVLGQISLDTDVGGCSRVNIGAAADVAVNPVTGDVFIADSLNNRIMVYLAATIKAAVELGITSFVNVQADFVLGQLDFISNVVMATNQGIINPVSIHIDSNQNLWVACKSANRVLKFNLVNAFVGLQSGVGLFLDAALVLGQNDFLSVGVAANLGLGISLSSPVDVVLDEAEDRLWVVDQGNKRVVFFNTASSLSTGAKISGFIGVNAHASANILGLISLDVSLDATVLVMPSSIVIDSSSNVYVADAVLNRVLRFTKAAYLNAAAQLDVNLLGLAQLEVSVTADLVIGQPNFVSCSSSPVTIGSLHQPLGLCIIPGLLSTADTLVNAGVQTTGTILNDAILVLSNLDHRASLFNLLPNVLPHGTTSSGPATSILGQPTSTSSYLYGNPQGIVSPAGFGLNLNSALFSSFYNWMFVCTGSRVLVYLCL